MGAEYALILQQGSNFRKKTAKKLVLPSKFQKDSSGKVPFPRLRDVWLQVCFD